MEPHRDELPGASVKGKSPLKDARVRKAPYQAIGINAIQRVTLRVLDQAISTLNSPGQRLDEKGAGASRLSVRFTACNRWCARSAWAVTALRRGLLFQPTNRCPDRTHQSRDRSEGLKRTDRDPLVLSHDDVACLPLYTQVIPWGDQEGHRSGASCGRPAGLAVVQGQLMRPAARFDARAAPFETPGKPAPGMPLAPDSMPAHSCF